MKRPSTLAPARVCLALGLAVASGCHAPKPLPPQSTGAADRSPKPAATVTTYTMVGVVRRVSPDAGQVVIAHEKLPGFMDAMTMPFTVKDRSLLDEMQPGDEVEGKLRVEKEGDVVKDYQLLDLAVTRPALASPKTFTLSKQGAKLTLREAPKRLEPGQAVPDFSVTTQEGKALKLSDLRGDVVVLTFIYTRCPLPDFCPLMDRKFADLAGKLAASPSRADRVRLLSISFDPEHDTPEVLRKHAQVQGARPPLWTFAVASHEELAKVAGPLGLTYGPGADEILHNLCTAVIDPDGRLARLDVGSAAKARQPSEQLKLIASLLSAARGHAKKD